MSFLGRLLGLIPAQTLPKEAPARSRSRTSASSQDTTTTTAPRGLGIATTYFEAVRQSPDRTPIPMHSLAFRRALGSAWSESAERELVAGLARYIVDNYGAAYYALDLVANYSTPVLPRAASFDPKWNILAEMAFDEWAMTCDFTRRFDFESLQRLACFSIDTDGDIGVTMPLVDGVPRLRFWPCWRIGSDTKLRPRAPLKGLEVFEGVILDQDDRVTGYEVMKRPSEQERFKVDEMLLLYESERYERVRGISSLRRGMNDLRDAHDIAGFEKLATKLEAALAGVIEGDAGLEEDWDGGAASDVEAEQTEEGETPAIIKPRGITMASLLGGDIPVIQGKLQQIESNRPGTNKIEFMDTLAGFFVSGMGIPPAFFLDVKLTGPNQRAVLGKAQRKFDKRKALMARFSRWVWVRKMAHLISTGQLPAVEGWHRCTFQTPAIATIDLGDQAKADREAVGAGLMSRQQFQGNKGKDWEDEDDQVFAEDESIIIKAKEQAARHGLPLETVLARHGFAQPKQAQPEEDDDEEASDAKAKKKKNAKADDDE